MPRTIICDLDGTLCDAEHRVHWAQAGDWDVFHSQSVHDKPNPDVADLLRCLRNQYIIIGCTGRNYRYAKITFDWLNKHDLAVFDEILFRPDDDYTPDHELKPRLLEEYFGNKATALDQVSFVLEDREKVVVVLRDYGLPVWQVVEGSY